MTTLEDLKEELSSSYDMIVDLSVECKMCDWELELGRAHVDFKLPWMGVTFPYILLKKNDEIYKIRRIEFKNPIYKLMRLDSRMSMYLGSIEECIKYFRQNIFLA